MQKSLPASRVVFYLIASAVFLTPLLYTPAWVPFAFGDRYFIKLTFVQLAAVLAVLLFIVEIARKNILRINLTFLFVPIVIYLIINLASVYYSPSIAISAEAFSRMVTYVLMFFLCANFVTGEDKIEKIFFCWKVSMVFVALYAVWQSRSGLEPYSTVGNRNYLATLMVLTTPVIFQQTIEGFKKRNIVSAAAGLIMTALFAYALIISGSRGGLLALGAVIFIFLEIVLFLKKKRILGLLLILTALSALFFVCESRFFIDQLKGDVRPYLWEGALKMIKSNFLFGCGPGAFFIRFPAFRPVEYFLLKKSADVTYHAHNELLNIWVETGIFGLLAFLAVIVVFYSKYFKFRTASGIKYADGLVFGVTGVLIQSLFDMTLAVPSTALFLWLSMGIAAGTVGEDRFIQFEVFSRKSFLRVFCVFLFAGILSVISYYAVVKPAAAQIYFGEAAKERKNLNWPKAVENYRKGLMYAPYNLEERYKMAYALDQAGDDPSAIEAYKKIEEISPNFARVNLNLGLLFEKTGRLRESAGELREWLKLNPYDQNAEGILAGVVSKLEKL